METQNCAGITNYAYDSVGSSCQLMSTSENGFNYVMEGQHATSYALDKSSNNINIDFSGIQTKQQEYNQGNQMAEKYGEQILNSSPHITPYINQTKNMYNQLNTKTNEYLYTHENRKTRRQATWRWAKVHVWRKHVNTLVQSSCICQRNNSSNGSQLSCKLDNRAQAT